MWARCAPRSAHRSLHHMGTALCGLCALRCPRGSALGRKDPGAPRPPPRLDRATDRGETLDSETCPSCVRRLPTQDTSGPPGVPAAMTWGLTPHPRCPLLPAAGCVSLSARGPRPPEPPPGLPQRALPAWIPSAALELNQAWKHLALPEEGPRLPPSPRAPGPGPQHKARRGRVGD